MTESRAPQSLDRWDTALPGSPANYGLGLAGVYALWLGILAALYPLCRWYGGRARKVPGRG